MDPLPNEYGHVATRVAFVEEWFKRRKREISTEVATIRLNDNDPGAWTLWPAGFVVGLMALALGLVAFGKGFIFWGVLCFLCVVPGFLFGIAGIRAGNRETRKLVAMKQRELDEDPLARRAGLILQAAQVFHVHSRSYQALYERVRDGVQSEDEDASGRYLQFLARHYAGIGRATDNLRRVVENVEYVAAQRKQYPELAAKGGDSTSLAALMEQLNEPVEAPPVFGVELDPLAALEQEELLEQIVRDADTVKNLDARIAAALGSADSVPSPRE